MGVSGQHYPTTAAALATFIFILVCEIALLAKTSSCSKGGQFTGNFCARELKKQFYVTVIDAKDRW